MGYRTIEAAYAYLRNIDPQSAITKYMLRMLCKSGNITVLNIGNKNLILMSSLLSYLKLDEGGNHNENQQLC